MKRDIGDIIDRYSIAILKDQRIGLLENTEEMIMFEKGYHDFMQNHLTDQSYIRDKLIQMIKINSNIWNLESDVRKGTLDSNVVEVGRRAIQIRKFNAKRVATKNEVNKHFNEGVQDVKKDHLSEIKE